MRARFTVEGESGGTLTLEVSDATIAARISSCQRVTRDAARDDHRGECFRCEGDEQRVWVRSAAAQGGAA